MGANSSVVEIAAAILSGGLVSEAFGWLRRRNADRKIARDAVADAAKGLVEAALKSANDQITRLEGEVQTLLRRTQELQTEVDQLRDDHTDCQRKTRALQDEIDRLMAGDIPAYRPGEVKPTRAA